MVLHSSKKLIFTLIATAAALAAAEPVSPEWRQALDRVSANSMRGHLSFLASDLLEGRNTPSRGLDTAAEYIAAQFRRAGLEPAGDDGYFQTAKFARREADPTGADLTFQADGGLIRLSGVQVAPSCPAALDFAPSGVVKSRVAGLGKLQAGSQLGKAIFIVDADSGKEDPRSILRDMLDATRRLTPALVLVAFRDQSRLGAIRRPELFDAENAPAEGPPVIAFSDPHISWLAEEKTALQVSAHCSARQEKTYPLRNVVGLLRGSDPALAGTAVIVSAHYDHVGMKEDGEGDRIYNGANDDGSGTTAVIEIASALAALPQKPKRSILFITFFGEEQGILGSRYYVRHPVIPLAKTVANINIEQVGRPWPIDKSKALKASTPGFEYSSLVTTLQQAAQLTGVELHKYPQGDSDYFFASDNIAFAEKGIPAHTVCTAYYFPDYHEVGDEWQKVDFDNMAGVTRMLALGALMVADSPQPPAWNAKSSGAERFRNARPKE